MASDQQTRALLARFSDPNFLFTGHARKVLHELCRSKGLDPHLTGYFLEMDAHPLPLVVDWGNGVREQAYLVECISGAPFYIRAVTVSFGKPTAFVLARTFLMAVLSPWGAPGLMSAPARLVLDNEPICKDKTLKELVAACDTRITYTRDYTAHAKPRVESCGAILKNLAIFPVEALAPTENTEPKKWLSLNAEALMATFESAVDAKNLAARQNWVTEMKRVALGLSEERVKEIALHQWATCVKVEGDMARLESGETFCSENIADLPPGRYAALRRLDPLDDTIQILFESDPVATASRTYSCPEPLRPYLHIMELPRL